MTPEAQRIAIAEACRTLRNFYCPQCREMRNEKQRHLKGDVWMCSFCSSGKLHQDSPNYLSDLNAMHEAEKVLPGETQHRDYIRALWKVIGRPSEHLAYFPMLHATAAQRAEALLRALGKWQE